MAVTDRFHEYIYGNTFEIYTYNTSLTSALMTAKLDVTGHRWIDILVNLNFSLHCKTGKTHVEADVLSRILWAIIKALIASLTALSEAFSHSHKFWSILRKMHNLVT